MAPTQPPPGRPPTIERRIDHGMRVVVVRDLAHLGWGMKVARRG